ncbi:MAG: ABC transporter permease [Nitrospirota bacterium]|nr:ABC transporter permease [Nitrospirota bacterium]MDE3224170.1 ABC transporter permease [Nitrospirota bacterium]MDE3241482.1 ABC transporter permease [Nitrospirota bacterium]
MLAISFASRGTYGGVVWTLTLANYANVVDPLYVRIFARSVGLATLTTLLCLALGFPIAYYIARLPPRLQGIWLLLVMIPFWTNFLVRTYAWIFILRAEGLLNTVLAGLGLIGSPVDVLYSETAIVIGLVYGYLPFMILPLYAAVERLPVALVEAAWDLYASRWAVFWRVIVPLTKPGLVAGAILVFIPSVGAFITPDLMGGARTMMIGNLIQHEFLVARDWPFGSAIGLVLMASVLLGVVTYLRAEGPGARPAAGG